MTSAQKYATYARYSVNRFMRWIPGYGWVSLMRIYGNTIANPRG